MGHLIPAGTGFKSNRNFELVHLGEPTLFEGDEVAEEATL